MSDGKRFEGMTAVVTGGASGIGLGVAKRIAAEGGRVTVWDQDPARLKAAVIHYTRCLAASVRTEGVRINAVSPGATKTARFEATRVVDPQKMDSSIKSLIRYGEPDEMADAVAFLAGPRSKYISGQVLRVDGGETLFPG